MQERSGIPAPDGKDGPDPTGARGTPGRTVLDHVHPEDRLAAEQAVTRAFRSGVPQIITCRQCQPDGSYRTAEFRADPDYDVAVPTSPMVQSPDEPWTIADTLGETAAAVRAAKVVEAMHGAAFAFDATGRFTYATPVAQTSIAMTLEDLNRPLDGRPFLEGGDLGWKLGVHPDDYEPAATRLRECMRTGEHFNFDYRVLRATGDYVWHRFVIRPTRAEDGRITGWYGNGFDIDVPKRTEVALRTRERELSHLVDMVPSHLWRLTPEGEPIFFNKRMIDFLGMDLADMERPGMTRLEAMIAAGIHAEDRAAFRDTLRGCLATGEPFALRYRLRRADGIYRWMSSRAEPMRNPEGYVVQWYGLCHDIEDQIHAEEALRRSERQLQQIIDAVPVHIWSWTPSGELAYVSKRYLAHLGITDGNLEDFSRVTEKLVHPEDAPGVRHLAADCLASGEPFVMRYRRLSKDGIYRWMEGRCEPLRDANGTIVQWYGVSIDIHEGVRAQEELRLAQENLARQTQAASLAELSASIAHEVNQPLAAIVANSHAGERWLAAEPPNIERARKAVERITRDANAAADIVSHIRALFQQSARTREKTEFGGVVALARDLMIEDATRRGVRMEVAVAGSLPPITIDRVQVQQVLINLMRNGMEAMDAVMGDRVLTIGVRRTEDTIQTDISDCGPGITVPDRIFEPFFSTKGQGMGMGLAICRSIVESHGGRLWAEPNTPRGARLAFTLPITGTIHDHP